MEKTAACQGIHGKAIAFDATFPFVNSDHACTRLYAGGDAHQLSMSIPAILTREDSLIEPLSRTSLRMVGVKFS